MERTIMMFFGWLLALFGLGALAYQFGWRSEVRKGPGGLSSNSALDILKERYARGEITRDEYISMREDLEH
jgi:putative membrane protein